MRERHEGAPHEVATGITLDMGRPDLGHPDMPDLWDRLHGHCNQGQVVCEVCRHPMYLQVRGGARVSCLYSEAEIAAWQGESDEHQALKDTISRFAMRAGLQAVQESPGAGRKRITDVMVSDGSCDVGWEVQLSPASPGSLARRIDQALQDSVVPSWLTTARSAGVRVITERTPLTTVHGLSVLEMVTAEDLAVRTGVKAIEIQPCGSYERSKGWHRRLRCSGWHGTPAILEKAPTLAAMVEGSVSGKYVPLQWPRRLGAYNKPWLWATSIDVDRFRDVEGLSSEKASQRTSARPDDVRTVTPWHESSPVLPEAPAEPEAQFSGRVTPVVHGTSAAGWHLQCGACGLPWTESARHERTTTCISCATKFGWINKKTKGRPRS